MTSAKRLDNDYLYVEPSAQTRLADRPQSIGLSMDVCNNIIQTSMVCQTNAVSRLCDSVAPKF